MAKLGNQVLVAPLTRQHQGSRGGEFIAQTDLVGAAAFPLPKVPTMAILKVIEVLAESPTSWEDAAKEAVAEAAKTVRGIRSIYIKNFEATVRDGAIENFRINAKVTFTVEV